MSKTTKSPIDEIHRTRREISARFGGDLEAIAADAARRQATSNRPIWRPNLTDNSSEEGDGPERVDPEESTFAAG